jgi:hypothetical protein
MQRRPTTPGSSGPTRRTVARRDAGLALVRRINGWLIAGAVAATGAVSAVAAQGFTGHASTATGSSSAATTRASTTTRQSQNAVSSAGTTTSQSSSPTSSGLQSPAQTPTAASSGSAGAVSGGS